ncbi:MAG: aminotransferase class III-fold pyridoxal phosphate-dependent enzyme [Gemmataceae bacterium]|nr:aminotransferase class III-fold pyridoxal phosphate-dependent enzyme [Gemmataceae bacterium]
MNNRTSQPAAPPSSPLLGCADAYRFRYTDADRELFDKHLRSFVPPNAFDVHAHLYDLRHLVPQGSPSEFAGSPRIDHAVLLKSMRQWMGDRVVTEGLYFPFPVRHLEPLAANDFLAAAIEGRPGCRGLMMLRPQDDPAAVEAQLRQHAFAGFKVYHVFAEREDSFFAEQGEFLPEWAWELANRYDLAITMHMVLPRALGDPRNQSYIREHCLRFPHAKLILAHAARGFNAGHTVEGIDALRGLSNVFFDTSAVCESTAFEAILRTFGVTRLMYGSDFPVSELRGRALSIGDGFFWLYDHNAQWDGWLHARPQLVGIESLLALQQACRTMHLKDRDIERLFGDNARAMLGLKRPTGEGVQALYREAKALMPGGTQLLSKRPEMFAPEQWPAYYEQAIGCEVIDTDGRRFIDMSHCGILSCILGFADPDVNAAVIRRVNLGNMATQQTADEVELAKLLIEIHPWAQQARFTRSGGEAMTVAVRIARAATGHDKLAVCGYHGWHDWYLAANLPGQQLDAHLLPGLQPTGVPRGLEGTVHTFRYNRLDELEAALKQCGDDLAVIVMEPTRNLDPDPGFLEAVREHADRRGAVLIFDEISAGWRLCLGGAHRLYGVTPDLAVFAKAMSNGFAMGAVIGRREIMQAAQDSFISSTYWTEGIGPAAAVAAVKKMQRIDVPVHLARLGTRVLEGWRTLGAKHGLALTIAGRPASCSLSFQHPQNAALLTLLTTRMLDRGFMAGGSCSLTLAHEMYHVERYLDALDQVFAELAAAIAADDISARLGGPVKHSTFARLVD